MGKCINIIIIFIAFMMIIGCTNQSQQSVYSSQGTTANSQRESLSESEESSYYSQESTTSSQQDSENQVEDDSYYENLIKDIKYPEIYGVKSDVELMDVVRLFVCDFDIVINNDQFSSPQELGDNKIFYYLTSLLFYDEFPESKEIDDTNENGVFFYKKETIEKYAYYFFNYKIDCTKINGWSEEKQGVYRFMEGFGGGRPDPVCDLKEIEPGKYQFTADFKYGDDYSDDTDYTLTAILGVEQNRVYLISLKRVYGK